MFDTALSLPLLQHRDGVDREDAVDTPAKNEKSSSHDNPALVAGHTVFVHRGSEEVKSVCRQSEHPENDGNSSRGIVQRAMSVSSHVVSLQKATIAEAGNDALRSEVTLQNNPEDNKRICFTEKSSDENTETFIRLRREPVSVNIEEHHGDQNQTDIKTRLNARAKTISEIYDKKSELADEIEKIRFRTPARESSSKNIKCFMKSKFDETCSKSHDELLLKQLYIEQGNLPSKMKSNVKEELRKMVAAFETQILGALDSEIAEFHRLMTRGTSTVSIDKLRQLERVKASVESGLYRQVVSVLLSRFYISEDFEIVMPKSIPSTRSIFGQPDLERTWREIAKDLSSLQWSFILTYTVSFVIGVIADFCTYGANIWIPRWGALGTACVVNASLAGANKSKVDQKALNALIDHVDKRLQDGSPCNLPEALKKYELLYEHFYEDNALSRKMKAVMITGTVATIAWGFGDLIPFHLLKPAKEVAKVAGGV